MFTTELQEGITNEAFHEMDDGILRPQIGGDYK